MAALSSSYLGRQERLLSMPTSFRVLVLLVCSVLYLSLWTLQVQVAQIETKAPMLSAHVRRIVLSGNTTLPFGASPSKSLRPEPIRGIVDDTFPPPRLIRFAGVADTVVIVLTARENFARRRTIRETWGRQNEASRTVPVYFVIGAPCLKQSGDQWSCDQDDYMSTNMSSQQHSQADELLREQSQHQDLLQISKPDSYRALPYKISEAYQWIFMNYPSVQWVVKTDDDMFVRLNSLSYYLQQLSRHSAHVLIKDTAQTTATKGLTPMLVGCIRYHSFVFGSGKWAEEEFKANEYYPPYAMGSCGHAASRPIVDYIARHRTSLHHYQNEDTSIGIWLNESTLDVQYILSSVFHNERACQDREHYIVGHGLTMESIRECFDTYGSRQESPEEIEQRAISALRGDDIVIVKGPMVKDSDRWREHADRRVAQGAAGLRLDNFRRGYGGQGQ